MGAEVSTITESLSGSSFLVLKPVKSDPKIDLAYLENINPIQL